MYGLTGFDFVVLFIVGVAAAGGFWRGFVQEILSLAAWILAIFAIRYMHTDLTAAIYQYFGSPSGAASLAFVLLLLVPYAAMKLIAGRMGETTRKSVLGPIDRVLGFGFGTIKGMIVVVMAFSLLVLGYDTIWGVAGRPTWITTARTYEFVRASSDALVEMIDDRRRHLEEESPPIAGGAV
jgi:membrane protein required for colicin V production